MLIKFYYCQSLTQQYYIIICIYIKSIIRNIFIDRMINIFPLDEAFKF